MQTETVGINLIKKKHFAITVFVQKTGECKIETFISPPLSSYLSSAGTKKARKGQHKCQGWASLDWGYPPHNLLSQRTATRKVKYQGWS